MATDMNQLSALNNLKFMPRMNRIFADTEALIFFLVIIGMTALVALIVSRYLQNKIIKKTKSEHADITNVLFIKHLVVATIYFVGFGWALLSLPITHTFAHSLFAGAGITTLVLGFASQGLFNNTISGMFLVLNRPFKVHDIIEFQGIKGKVVEININSVKVREEDGNITIIPSSLFLSNKLKIIDKASHQHNN